MRIFFLIFILFLLYILELFIGNFGIYLPLAWLGFFYFDTARYHFRTLVGIGIAGVLLTDLILYARYFLPDGLLLIFVMFYSFRYREFWRGAAWRGAFFGPFLLIAAYVLQFAAVWFEHQLTVDEVLNITAMMITLLPIVYLIQFELIILLDFLQKKIKIEQAFVLTRNERDGIFYRRSSRRDF